MAEQGRPGTGRERARSELLRLSDDEFFPLVLRAKLVAVRFARFEPRDGAHRMFTTDAWLPAAAQPT
ncbi:hypothetical protein [Frankia tisae]|uniref:hypothetical protein n=1 Tax=Frankia tisae TaxID=2950104 RepID=UPI0021BFF59C|nr:hypothetical protein [Frankia tisae]